MHLWHWVWFTLSAYCILHSYVFIKDIAAVSQQGHHFTNCRLAFIPKTRNTPCNADIDSGHEEEVHRQFIQRRRKGKGRNVLKRPTSIATEMAVLMAMKSGIILKA